jgi:hypothetical protein
MRTAHLCRGTRPARCGCGLCRGAHTCAGPTKAGGGGSMGSGGVCVAASATRRMPWLAAGAQQAPLPAPPPCWCAGEPLGLSW